MHGRTHELEPHVLRRLGRGRARDGQQEMLDGRLRRRDVRLGREPTQLLEGRVASVVVWQVLDVLVVGDELLELAAALRAPVPRELLLLFLRPRPLLFPPLLFFVVLASAQMSRAPEAGDPPAATYARP